MIRGIVKVTDLLHWHCVQCDARLNMAYQRWAPGDMAVYATTFGDARKTCPTCAAEDVPSIETQVTRTMSDALLRIMREQTQGRRLQ